MANSVFCPASRWICMAALFRLKAFSKRQEHRNWQTRQPVHLSGWAITGGPFLWSLFNGLSGTRLLFVHYSYSLHFQKQVWF